MMGNIGRSWVKIITLSLMLVVIKETKDNEKLVVIKKNFLTKIGHNTCTNHLNLNNIVGVLL